LVSVIVPAYNVSEWIGQALGSVYAQTMDDLEVIVVDDGSTDGPALDAALAPFRNRLTLIRQPNQGVAAARNAAARVAKGKWLAFLDGDDFWHPGYLAAQVEFLAAHRLGMVWSNGTVFGDPQRGGQGLLALGSPQIGIGIPDLISEQLFIITSATVVSAASVAAVGGFDERLRRAQDFELWVRLINSGVRVGYNPRLLMSYRVRPGSLSGGVRAQTVRALEVLLHILTHLSLMPSDKAIIQARVGILEAKLSLLSGKSSLRAGRFEEAADALGKAYSQLRTWKLYLVVTALRIAPRLTRWLFVRVSSEELE